MDVMAGEEVGIVGRTPGAGESSILTALYRLVEFSSGSVAIDGVEPFRPQESPCNYSPRSTSVKAKPSSYFTRILNLTDVLVVSGTLRSNLDLLNLHDATLWDALKRSYRDGSAVRYSITKKKKRQTLFALTRL